MRLMHTHVHLLACHSCSEHKWWVGVQFAISRQTKIEQFLDVKWHSNMFASIVGISQEHQFVQHSQAQPDLTQQ